MEAYNILADQVKICRPVFIKFIRRMTVRVIADARDVVGQGVQPDVNDMLRVKVYGNSPLERGS